MNINSPTSSRVGASDCFLGFALLDWGELPNRSVEKGVGSVGYFRFNEALRFVSDWVRMGTSSLPDEQADAQPERRVDSDCFSITL